MLKIKKIKNDAKEFSIMSFTLTREIGNASDPMRPCGTHNNKYWLIAFDFDELPAQKALKKKSNSQSCRAVRPIEWCQISKCLHRRFVFKGLFCIAPREEEIGSIFFFLFFTDLGHVLFFQYSTRTSYLISFSASYSLIACQTHKLFLFAKIEPKLKQYFTYYFSL